MKKEKNMDEEVRKGSFDDLVRSRARVYEVTEGDLAEDNKGLRRVENYGKKKASLAEAFNRGDLSSEEFIKKDSTLDRNFAKRDTQKKSD